MIKKLLLLTTYSIFTFSSLTLTGCSEDKNSETQVNNTSTIETKTQVHDLGFDLGTFVNRYNDTVEQDSLTKPLKISAFALGGNSEPVEGSHNLKKYTLFHKDLGDSVADFFVIADGTTQRVITADLLVGVKANAKNKKVALGLVNVLGGVMLNSTGDLQSLDNSILIFSKMLSDASNNESLSDLYQVKGISYKLQIKKYEDGTSFNLTAK